MLFHPNLLSLCLACNEKRTENMFTLNAHHESLRADTETCIFVNKNVNLYKTGTTFQMEEFVFPDKNSLGSYEALTEYGYEKNLRDVLSNQNYF